MIHYIYNYNQNFVNYNFDKRSWKLVNPPNQKLGEDQPWGVSKLVSHLFYKNTFSNVNALDEDTLKFKNIVLDTNGNVISNRKKFYLDIVKYLEKQDKKTSGSNNFIAKTIIETLNLNPQAPVNQDLIKEWFEERFSYYKKLYGKKLLGASLHLNETSAHINILLENTKTRNGVLVYGVEEPKIVLCEEIQKEKDEYIKKYNKEHPDKPFKQHHNGRFEAKQVWRNGFEYMKDFAKRHKGLNYQQVEVVASGKTLVNALKDVKTYKKLINKFKYIVKSEFSNEYDTIIKELTTELEKANEEKIKNIQSQQNSEHIINKPKIIKRSK